MAGNLIQKLLALRNQPLTKKALVGFDGYVDLIQKAVKTTTGEKKHYYSSLSEVGGRIAGAAGKSAQIELCTQTTKLGGNGPIMANALAHLGIHNHCVGMMGYPEVHPAFLDMHENCHVLSIGEPGRTNALEFEDGKLILSEVSTFESLNLPYIFGLRGDCFLGEYLRESSLIAMVDWANLPLCTQLWEQLHAFIHQLGLAKKVYFFDLCDPSKKTPAEIQEVLGVISRYKELGTVILGLNENEVVKVYGALLGILPADPDHAVESTHYQLEDITAAVFRAMDIDALLVHPVDRSLLATTTGVVIRKGSVVSCPKILTGGGDNLNAGFCFGILNSFSLEESMVLGMAASGAYVQNGHSPLLDELIAYLETM
jgi:hypothetical protein